MPKRRLGAARAGAALAVPLLLGMTAAPVSAHFLRPAAVQTAAPGDHDLDNVLEERVSLNVDRISRGAARSDPTATVEAATFAAPDTGRRVRPAPGPLTGYFGEGRGSHRHPGVDIDGETGDPVVAAAGGVVEIAGG